AGLLGRAVPALGRHAGQAAGPAPGTHPDAPGLGGDRRFLRRGRGPGQRPAPHPRYRPGAHRRGHRPAGRADLRGLAARPLVHRSRSPRVRLHRRGRRRLCDDRPGQEPPCRAGGGPMSSYTIPHVVARNANGERIMDVYSHLLTERIVYLGTAIDPGVANALLAQLLHLDSDSPGTPIDLYINSEGGDLPAMLAVYDTMQYLKSPVSTICVGQAIGASAVLLTGGAAGRRMMLPHARVVLHQPAGQGRGTIPDLILQADELLRTRGAAERVLA